MPTPPDNSQSEPCDHDWKVVDESFDHEFGTERVVFERCEKCDAEREYERPDPLPDDVL